MDAHRELSLATRACYWQGITGSKVFSKEDLAIIDAAIRDAETKGLSDEAITDFYLLWTLPTAVGSAILITEERAARIQSMILSSPYRQIIDAPIARLKTHGAPIDRYVLKALESGLDHKKVAINIRANHYILNSGDFQNDEITAIFQYGIDHNPRKWLRLDSLKLKDVPPGILQVKGIEVLHLNGNPITKLPPEFFGLKDLRELKLEGTRISELPKGLGRLTNLELLSLKYSRLEKVPAEIGQLGRLQELWLNESRLEDLPEEIAELKELKRIAIGLTPLARKTARVAQLREMGCPL
ncbi:MAG: hypothetical protein CMN77_13295 [Spirochaetaceae bacterium]|nr:hypothetical protein [Spirochaetaceae bacterium]|tara:strand:+ start:81450 stop:82343 length:894 start_codon:yes stop_codon:yes gene_type:complete